MQIFNFKSENTIKTLGLGWSPADDAFSFECRLSKEPTSKLTKRRLLSEISKVFDPLGWLAPVVTKLKLIFQKVWIEVKEWEDEVSAESLTEWIKIRTDLENINQCTVPRWIGSGEKGVIELIGYCDSSEKAITCVYYTCCTNKR